MGDLVPGIGQPLKNEVPGALAESFSKCRPRQSVICLLQVHGQNEHTVEVTTSGSGGCRVGSWLRSDFAWATPRFSAEMGGLPR